MIQLEELEMIIGVVIIMFVFLISFLVGKYQDIVWRARALRKMTKKDYILLNIRNNDTKTITQILIVPDMGTITIPGTNMQWMVKKERIYRVDKEELGFSIKKRDLKFQEGVPSLFVDYDNVKPIDFEGGKFGVTPGELGAWNQAYIKNEIQKDQKTIKSLQQIITILLVLGLINLALSGFNAKQIGDQNMDIQTIKNNTISKTVTISETPTGTVVKQPGVK